MTTLSPDSESRPKSLSVRVDVDTPVPPYEQLRAQLVGLIEAGELVPGDRLPPVRQLASDLGLASGTVARAYRELDQVGLIEGRGRRGTVVREHPSVTVEEQARQRALSAAAERFAATARSFGLSDDAVLAAARAALARLTPQQA